MALTKLQKSSIFYLAGCCIQALSLFLPWYFYKVTTDISRSAWELYLFEEWKPVYTIQPITAELPTLPVALSLAIGNCAYIGIGIAFALVFLLKKDATPVQETTMYGFMALGPILSVALIIILLLRLVIAGYYIPYLQIERVHESIRMTKIYSLSYGFGISILGTAMMLVPVSLGDYSKLFTIGRLSKLRTPRNEPRTPSIEDVQQMEDRYLSLYSQQTQTQEEP